MVLPPETTPLDDLLRPYASSTRTTCPVVGRVIFIPFARQWRIDIDVCSNSQLGRNWKKRAWQRATHILMGHDSRWMPTTEVGTAQSRERRRYALACASPLAISGLRHR